MGGVRCAHPAWVSPVGYFHQREKYANPCQTCAGKMLVKKCKLSGQNAPLKRQRP